MKLNPQISLAFNGQCEAAFRLYEQCLNGTIAYMLTWGNSPMAADAPPGWDAKIYHATAIDDAELARRVARLTTVLAGTHASMRTDCGTVYHLFMG